MNIDYLKSRLEYLPETGELIWKTHRCKEYIGKVAGTVGFHGYRIISLDSRKLRASRLAWAIYNGKWPENNIDHINRNRLDDRICNLRDVTQAENSKNNSVSSNNTSGITGVFYLKDRKRWVARIKVNYKEIRIGYFATFNDALIARKMAEYDHGFTDV